MQLFDSEELQRTLKESPPNQTHKQLLGSFYDTHSGKLAKYSRALLADARIPRPEVLKHTRDIAWALPLPEAHTAWPLPFPAPTATSSVSPSSPSSLDSSGSAHVRVMCVSCCMYQDADFSHLSHLPHLSHFCIVCARDMCMSSECQDSNNLQTRTEPLCRSLFLTLPPKLPPTLPSASPCDMTIFIVVRIIGATKLGVPRRVKSSQCRAALWQERFLCMRAYPAPR